MTMNGRASEPSSAESSDNPQAEPESSQSPSGVFRASRPAKGRDAGWTVAEQFEHEGFAYRVMRRPLELANSSPRLTKREEDVLVLACARHSNKSIAQVLDVSPSTVGVLLFRAAGKLNAKSRSELLANYEQFKAESLGKVRNDDGSGEEQ